MNMVTTEPATRRELWLRLHSLIVDEQLPVPREVSFHDSTERCHVWLTFDHPHNVLAWTPVLNLAPRDSIWSGSLDGWSVYATVVGESMTELLLERRDQANQTPQIGNIMLTPAIHEDYWAYRVRVGEAQAIVAFPKFATIGIGFAKEEDWNTNLPWTCGAREIFDHIAHNKADDAIADEDCVRAIEMIQAAIRGDAVGGGS